jgi:hypothetical protein
MHHRISVGGPRKHSKLPRISKFTRIAARVQASGFRAERPPACRSGRRNRCPALEMTDWHGGWDAERATTSVPCKAYQHGLKWRNVRTF